MLKKFIPLAVSVALLAFAVPAAQATGPLITSAFGETAETITIEGTGTTTHTSIGALECARTRLPVNLTENANTTVRGHGAGTMEGTPGVINSGHCATATGPIAEITAIVVSDFHLTKHGAETTGTATLFYTYDLRSSTGGNLIAECTFGGTLAVRRLGFSSISVEGEVKKTAGTAFCPAVGTFTGAFFVFDKNGTTATIH
jgi:hypothetical protein